LVRKLKVIDLPGTQAFCNFQHHSIAHNIIERARFAYDLWLKNLRWTMTQLLQTGVSAPDSLEIGQHLIQEKTPHCEHQG
jgi:hypothetical protein